MQREDGGAASGGGAAEAANPEAPACAGEGASDDAPARQSKRSRGSVDYSALEAKLQEEEEGSHPKKPKSE